MSPPISSRALTVLLAALCAAIFVVDLRTPLGYAVPLLYGLPLLLTLWHPARQSPLWVAAVGTILIAIGFLKSTAGGATGIGLVNRGLIIGLGWLLACLLVYFKRTHSQLAASESNLLRTQHVVDGAPDAILFADARKRIVYANEEACRSLGYTREELLQLTVPDISARHDPARYASRLDALQRGEAVCYESVHRRKDGSEFPIEMTLRYQNHGGRPVTCAIARDITERKRVESALRLQEFAMDHSSEGMFIVAADGRILGANETVCRRLEYTRDELLTMTIADIDPDYSRERWPSHWQELKQAGRLVIETTNRAKSGRIFPVEVSIAYLPWDGREICCSVITDISARKAAEAKLAETAAMLELVIEGSPDPIFLKDLDGKHLLMNRAGAEFLGRNKEDILGKRDAELFPQEVAAQLRHVDEAVLQSGQAGTFEEVIERADGTHTFISRKAPFRDATGKIVGLLGLAHDITARKEAEVKLERRLALEQLMAEISTTFINVTSGEVDAEINSALARVGRLLEVDRGYVFKLSEDGATMSNTYEWCAAGISSEKDKLQQLPVDAFPWWMERLKRDEPIAIPSVAKLPPEAEAERLSFQGQGIQSLIAVPITKRSRPFGFIGFDSVKTAKVWPDEDVLLLRTLGEIFVHAQDRLQAEARVLEANQTLEAQVAERTRSLRLTQFSMDRAADAVFWVAPDATILYVNDAASRLLGYTREELVGRTVPDIDPGFRAEAWPAHWEEVRRRGSFTFDSTHLKKDGTLLQTEVTVNHLVYEGQEYNCAFMRDITVRKEAEAALKASEARFRQVTESIQDVFWLSSPDKATIHYVSPAYEAIWGQSCQSLYEQPRSWLEAIHPDDRERVAQAAQTRQVEGRYRETYRIVRPDGTTRWIEDVGFPVFDHDRRVVRVAGVASDITIRKEAESALKDLNRTLEQRVEERTAKLAELNAALLADIEVRQQAEAALAASEARFRAAYQNAAVGMTLCSTDGILQAVNPKFCEIVGRVESEIVGRSFADLTHPEDLPESLEHLRRLVSHEAHEAVFEKRYLKPSGDVVWVSLSVTHLAEGEGEGEGRKSYLLTIVQDITARKQAEEELLTANITFQHALDGISELDGEGRYVSVNAAYAAGVGYQPEEMVGLSWQQTVHPDDLDAVRAIYECMRRDGKAEGEARGIRKDGSVIYKYVVLIKPLASSPSKADHYYCFMKDITARKQAEEALQLSHRRLEDSESFLRSVVDNLPHMVFIKDARDLRFVRFNKAAEELVGLTESEVLGKNDYEFFPKEQADFFIAKDRGVLESGRVIEIDAEPIQTKHRGLRYLRTKKFPLFDQEGRPQFLVGISDDVTDQRVMEAALRESEQRYRAVVESQSELVCRFRQDTTLTFVNEAYARYFGRRADEFIGKSFLDLIPDQDRAKARAHLEDLAKFRHPIVYEHRVLLPSGELRWQEWDDRAICDEAGRVLEFQSVGRDVTDRKLAELALSQREREFRTLADNVPAFFSYVDADLHYRFINRRYETFFGMSASALVGKPVAEVLGEANYRRVEPYLREALSGQVVRYEYEMQFEGERRPWFSVAYHPDRDAEGKVVGIFALVTDVSALKQAEQALRESETRFRAIFEQAAVGVAQLDSQTGRFVRVNQKYCDIVGLTAEQMTASTFMAITHPEDVQPDLDNMAALKEGRIQTFTMDKRYIRPDGSIVWVTLTVSPMWAPGATPDFHIAVVEDITARKEAEAALRESEERFRLVAEQVEEVLWILDLSSQAIVYANPAFERVWGRPLADLYRDRTTFLSAIHQADQPALFAAMAGFEQGVFDPVEYRIVRGDGTTRWIRDRAFPIRDAEGRVVRVAGLAEDITARKEAEAALALSEARHRSVVTALAEGIVIQDPQGQIVSCNASACRILGLSEDQLLGRTSLDPRWRTTHEDGSPFLGDTHPAMETLRTGLACANVVMGVHRPDESLVWISINTEPIALPEALGGLGVVASFRDITAQKRAEAALRASEERFRQVFEQSRVALCLVDRDYRFLKVNRAMCDLVGYDESELIGQTYALFTHPDDLAHNLSMTHELLDGQRTQYDLEKRYIRKDGRQIWVSVSASGISFPGDQDPKILALIQDVTEQRSSADALRDSEERFRSAFELSPIGMALCTPEGRFVRLNLQFCQLLGYAEQELRGRHVSEVTHPDEITRGREGLAALVSGQISVYVDEHRYLRKDGAVLTVLLTLSTIRNHEGRPLFSLAQIQDLTALRKTEADLRQAKELAAERARFQALVAALPDLAFVVDRDGRYREVLTGHEDELYRPAQEVLGRTFHDVFPPELADRFLEFVGRTIDSKESQILQYPLPMSDGIHWYEAKSSPPLPGASGPPALLCVVRDITERMRSQALEERERIGRDLHDGILQSLYATGLALESSQDLLNERPREGRELLDKVVEQLNGVMQEVRQYIVGLDAGVLQGDDWEAAARDLIQSHSAFYQVRSEIAIDPAAREALGVAERLALLNILREALSNALRHGRPQSIIISLSRQDETIRLRIADDGRGFHPTAIGKAGFGLRNMKARADQLGAVFQITSELGKGTEVIVEVRSQEVPDHARIPR